MSIHQTTLEWQLGDDDFSYKNYSRNHQWDFGHGLILTASAAPEFLGDENRVDPEQAFVASISSCHMLTFLAIASRKRLKVLSYRDDAAGWLEKNQQGRLSITRIELRPKIEFENPTDIDAEKLSKIHHQSHIECFIANSVHTVIEIIDESL